ncbi:NUDIX hydrolase [Roseibium sp. FZY0029]|uniref:NUDIX hydrolase n=1 Tax=Roseibium sp. FZY0029 TaxID=3116647 RepID=UPI002E9A5A65|nr:NUDIX hydrolase [Roseibium sp. FZY0029]
MVQKDSAVRPWKVVSSKTLIKDQWIYLRADCCQRADGSIVEPFYIQEAPDSVCVLALTLDGMVVVTNEYRHGAASVISGLPGGVVDSSDADPQSAAVRELLEETGYRGDQIVCVGYTYANAARQTNTIHHYLVENAVKIMEQRLDDNEEISVSLHSLETVRDPGFLKQSSSVACLYLALAYLQHTPFRRDYDVPSLGAK